MAKYSTTTTDKQIIDKQTGEVKEFKTTYKNKTTAINANGIFNSLSLVICLLLLVALVRNLTGGEIPTFASFLEMLTNIPSIDITFLSRLTEAVTIDSGLQWLDTIVNMFGSIIVVIVYIGTGIAQLLTYVVYILGWIFA